MKHVLSRFSAVCVATLFLVAVCPEMSAQPAAAATSAKPATPEDLGQSELLKAYLQLREQLHATQLAIANSRAEAEATARTQAAANAEKVEAIRLAIDSERQRQQAERERQQLETQRSNWMVLWIAAAFGGVGLLAVLAMPLIQLRAINKMSELAAGRPTLAAPSTPALLAPEAVGPPEEAVTQSNQRLLSALDRMEKRIMELEQTASSPLPAAAAKPANGTSATVEVTTVKSLPPNRRPRARRQRTPRPTPTTRRGLPC